MRRVGSVKRRRSALTLHVQTEWHCEFVLKTQSEQRAFAMGTVVMARGSGASAAAAARMRAEEPAAAAEQQGNQLLTPASRLCIPQTLPAYVHVPKVCVFVHQHRRGTVEMASDIKTITIKLLI